MVSTKTPSPAKVTENACANNKHTNQVPMRAADRSADERRIGGTPRSLGGGKPADPRIGGTPRGMGGMSGAFGGSPRALGAGPSRGSVLSAQTRARDVQLERERDERRVK